MEKIRALESKKEGEIKKKRLINITMFINL
jgi:hypothetical protein